MPPDAPDSAALQALCEQGLIAHRAGRLEEASRLYQAVLAADPAHVGALHLLGVYCVQTGRPEPAAELIGQAVALQPDFADAWANLATALNGLGRHEEALAAADRAIVLQPGHAAAHGNRGQALRALGRTEAALASYDQAAALNPTAQAHFNCAAVLRELGRPAAALARYDQAIALNPTYAESHCSRGIVLRDLGRPEAALMALDQAIALRPDYAEAHGNRGNVLVDLGQHSEALASYETAIGLNPAYFEVLSNRAAPLRELRRPQEALAASDEALAVNPDYAEAHSNRGAALYDLRRLDEALAAYDRAIALKPGYAAAHSNRGTVLLELRRLDAALADYDAAIAARPDYADAHYNQAMCRLALGDDAAGWAQYEWRWKTDQLGPAQRHADRPLWLGEESLQGRTILLHAEQGLGDTLQFCRYAPAVAALGATVFLEVPRGLERLLGRMVGVAQVMTMGDDLPPFDFQAPMMSLPHALSKAGSGAGFGPQTAYLRADPGRAAIWAERLEPSAGLRVGLCWAGGLRPDQLIADGIDQRRSLPLAVFAPLAAVEGAVFYSLQKGPPSGQLAELAGQGWAGPEIRDLTAELKDFDDTASLAANLDLVITCDTAVAHLAGGMGKPIWILNRFDACWRWLDGRDNSPWYPSARLFRQAAPGDWEAVMTRVAAELDGLAPG